MFDGIPIPRPRSKVTKSRVTQDRRSLPAFRHEYWAVGHCFGGTAALELARSGVTTSATVGFYCGLQSVASQEAGAINSRVLVCLGAMDPLVPATQRAAFEEEIGRRGADWQMIVYGGARHSFTNPEASGASWDALDYSPSADARSWTAMLSLLEEAFKAGCPGKRREVTDGLGLVE